MKRVFGWILIVMCLLTGCCGCRSVSERGAREDSAGTGYGVTQRSILQQKDLYSITRKMARSAVEAQLGSPHSVSLTDPNAVTYRLADGAALKIIYDSRDQLSQAEYTDVLGDETDFFDQLALWGVRRSSSGKTSTEEKTPEENEPASQENPYEPAIPGETEETWFSNRLYSPEAAKEILKIGTARDTVLSSFGKPNGYTSIAFARDSYLIDVYVLTDGSVLHADYGYTRSTLRAVRRIEGSDRSDFAGSWGAQEKPAGFYRITRNVSAIPALYKGSSPAAVYALIGEPDWLEGDESRYRDAYQLIGGAVLYLDFGTAHSRLVSGTIQSADGKDTVFSVK